MDIDFQIEHYFPTNGNNVYIRKMRLDAGQSIDTHEHRYDHYSILGSGEAIVRIDGVNTRYVAGSVIEIKAGKKHRISAVKDITWFCVHGTEEDDPERVDQVLIKEG